MLGVKSGQLYTTVMQHSCSCIYTQLKFTGLVESKKHSKNLYQESGTSPKSFPGGATFGNNTMQQDVQNVYPDGIVGGMRGSGKTSVCSVLHEARRLCHASPTPTSAPLYLPLALLFLCRSLPQKPYSQRACTMSSCMTRARRPPGLEPCFWRFRPLR